MNTPVPSSFNRDSVALTSYRAHCTGLTKSGNAYLDSDLSYQSPFWPVHVRYRELTKDEGLKRDGGSLGHDGWGLSNICWSKGSWDRKTTLLCADALAYLRFLWFDRASSTQVRPPLLEKSNRKRKKSCVLHVLVALSPMSHLRLGTFQLVIRPNDEQC